MKNYFLFFLSLFLCATINSTAQSTFFDVIKTPPFKDIKKGGELVGVHTFEEGGVVLIRAVKKQHFVSAFNSKYEMIANVPLEKERKELFIGSVADDKVIRVFSVNIVDKKTRELYCQTYNLSSKSIEKTKLYTTNATGKGGGKFGLLLTLFGDRKHEENFRLSPNGEYMAFIADNINKKTNSYSVRVFDWDLNEVYATSYYKDIENYFQFDDFVVTNIGEVICAGKFYKRGDKEKRKGKANYQYIIHKIDGNGSTSKEINLGENFVNELTFAQTENTLRLVGFYSEKKLNKMKGGLSYSFSGTDIEKIEIKKSPFPESVYKDIFREKKAKRLKEKEKEFSNFYLDYSFVDDEGNAYLLAEQFYVTYQTTGAGINGGFGTTTPVYHFNSILVLKFDVEGNLAWGRTLLKTDTRPSYNAFVMDNQLHLLLNTGKNVREKSDGRQKVKRGTFSSTALFDISFDKDTGDQSFNIIQENKGKSYYNPYTGNWGYNAFVMANLSKNKKTIFNLKEKRLAI